MDYKTRRQVASNRRRLSILQAASDCFAQRGYRRCTVAQIAREAGVSKGLVFHLFGSKQALFDDLVTDCLNRWSTLSEYRASAASKGCLEELHRLFMASFDFIAENPVLTIFARSDEALLQAHKADLARRNLLWQRRIQRTLQAGVRTGEIRQLDTQRMAKVFHELQITFLTNALSRSEPRSYDRETVELALTTLLRGVRASGEGV